MLKDADERSVRNVKKVLQEMVVECLRTLGLSRIPLDFDGSVQSTSRRAQGTAVGFNKKKKGARSYYPLFCTVSQTGQVLDLLHRSGNVHDSRGAREFMIACISAVREALPSAVIEVRADSAFFSDEIVTVLLGHRVEFTLSVPFERFTQLKGMIESRRRWHRFNCDLSFFEKSWKPKSWERAYRFVFVRTRAKKQQKGPVQLALNAPRHHVASKIYQKHLESCGITGGAARVLLARRLSDIVFAMLRDGREYDLEYHMTHKNSAA